MVWTCLQLRLLFTLSGAKIVYTYDVYWEESDIAWSSRWDAYLRMPGGRVRCTILADCLHIAETHTWSLSCILTKSLTC